MDISPTQTEIAGRTGGDGTEVHPAPLAPHRLAGTGDFRGDALTRHEAAMELHALAGMDVPGGPLLHDRHVGAHDQGDTHAGR